EIRVGDGIFHQSHSKSEQSSAHDLAARESRIQNFSHIVNADHPLDSYLAEKIHSHFNENCAERLERKFFALFVVRIGFEIGLNWERRICLPFLLQFFANANDRRADARGQPGSAMDRRFWKTRVAQSAP